MILPPHQTGRQLGEAGVQRALEAAGDTWLAGAMDALRAFVALPEWGSFRLEDFRAWYLAEGLPPPHDFHAWGGVAKHACKAGIIRFTGRYEPSVSPKTHGHPVRVWEAA